MKWVNRWFDVIAAKPSKPGVWRRKAGGFRIRGRVTDPRTGKLREVNKALPTCSSARLAYDELQRELEAIKAGAVERDIAIPFFHEWAATVFDRKVTSNKIRSAKGREQWASILVNHLIPAFGDFYVDQLRHADVEAWKGRMAELVRAGKYKPTTVNTWLSKLGVIMGAAVAEFELDRDPMLRIEPLDTSLHHTYTEEEPNALLPEDVPRFLEAMRRLHPQHYAMTFLGITTGLRPSSLRPLRRGGPTPDVRLDEGVLLVRRSHTRKAEVMETTKTKRHQRIDMPAALVEVLRWHLAELPAGPMRDSELLFPSISGGFRSASVLDKPFRDVVAALELPYRLTPRALRRTFQDLARSAGVQDVVTRAISGHATEAMQRHYSTVNSAEVREGLARVIDLASYRDELEADPAAPAPELPGGDHGASGGVAGGVAPETRNGRSG